MDFSEARDSESQWHQLDHMQVCTLLQTDNHTSTPPICFLQTGCPSCHLTNSVKELKAKCLMLSVTEISRDLIKIMIIIITHLLFHCHSRQSWTCQEYEPSGIVHKGHLQNAHTTGIHSTVKAKGWCLSVHFT